MTFIKDLNRRLFALVNFDNDIIPILNSSDNHPNFHHQVVAGKIYIYWSDGIETEKCEYDYDMDKNKVKFPEAESPKSFASVDDLAYMVHQDAMKRLIGRISDNTATQHKFNQILELLSDYKISMK